MSDEWMVRVQGREYGPVDTEALREWKAEGRLIATNEIRRVSEERWFRAIELPEIFAPEPLDEPPDLIVRRRSWREIVSETIRLYRRGFWRFMIFGLLTAIPMYVLQSAFPRIALPDLASGQAPSIPSVTVPPICYLMLLVLLFAWPVSTAGFQYVADDILHGRQRSLSEQFAAVLQRWSRVLGAGLLVYFSYFFWFFLPLTVMVALLAGGISVLSLLLYLLIGAFMVYMNARLFINFLFWEQTASLGDEGALLAIRESKELARCDPEAPRLDRPLYRGALVASIWLLLLLFLTLAAQLPFTLIRLANVQDPQQAIAMMQSLAQAKTPDALMIAADVAGAVMNLVVRPLLATSFIVLYYDAKARLRK
jgi:hypothetical protein